MKLLGLWGCFCVLCLAAGLARGQNIYLDFDGGNTFTPNFVQNRQGIGLSWSPNAGIDDESGAPGGGVVSTGAGQVTAEHIGPQTFSPDTGLFYTVSEYVKLNSIGTTGDTILALTLGEKSLLDNEGRGITCAFGNLDGTHLSVDFIFRDPAISGSGPLLVPIQVNLGHWFQVTFNINESVVAAGFFIATVEVADFGPTGEVSAQVPQNVTYSFANVLLSGTTAADWVPSWRTSIGGNAFDNFAVGITDVSYGNRLVAKGDPAPGVANAVFSVIGDPAIGKGGQAAFQALVTGTGKDSGVTAANNSGIWLYKASGTGALIAQTGKTSTAAPGTNGAAFAKLSDPLLSNAALGFYATLVPGTGDATMKNDAGVWTQASQGLNIYVRKGGAAPGFRNATISAISQFGLEESGSAPILGMAAGSGIDSSNDMCFWLPDSDGVLQFGYQSSQDFQAWAPQKYVNGQSRSVDVIDHYGTAIVNSENARAISLATPNGATIPGLTTSAVIATDNAAPGLTGPTIKSFGLPAVNDIGTVAFSFVMEGDGVDATNDSGIAILPAGGSASLLARTGDVAPGTSGAIFSALSAPVLCNTMTGSGAIAFVGSLAPGIGDTEPKGANAQGIWSNISGSMQLIVRQGDLTPQGGAFASFDQIALTDSGDIIFQGALSGVPAYANQGIGYYDGPGDVFVAASTGALVQVGQTMKTIKSLKIFPIAPYSMGQTRSFDPASGDFVYTATYTDDTWAVFLVHF